MIKPGLYLLTALEEREEKQVIITLDGVNYLIEEDPDDGWRSYLRSISETDLVPTAPSISQKVLVRAHPDDEDGIMILNANTGEDILYAYTDSSDCYYPYAVINVFPEHIDKTSNTEIRKDTRGEDIRVGDKVLYIRTWYDGKFNRIVNAKIVRFTPEKIVIEAEGETFYRWSNSKLPSNQTYTIGNRLIRFDW